VWQGACVRTRLAEEAPRIFNRSELGGDCTEKNNGDKLVVNVLGSNLRKMAEGRMVVSMLPRITSEGAWRRVGSRVPSQGGKAQ